MDERAQQILAVIGSLRPGDVVSYGDVARDAGHPRHARLVGRLLALGETLGPTAAGLPWWRVVTADGRLVPGLEHEQAARLGAEGVEVVGDRVRTSPSGRFSR